MFFTVLSTVGWAHWRPPAGGVSDQRQLGRLVQVQYALHALHSRCQGRKASIGGVKIGQFAMEAGQRRAAVPDSFDELDERFFSLGQDDSYYENLNELGSGLRDVVLRGLRDIALDQQLFKRARSESVTGMSLLRSVTPATVQGQFRRLARGEARLSRYEFSYTGPKPTRSRAEPVTLSFVVSPKSQPPTNIHVLIGRNGVGKTRLLHHMTRALVEDGADAGIVGSSRVTQRRS